MSFDGCPHPCRSCEFIFNSILLGPSRSFSFFDINKSYALVVDFQDPKKVFSAFFVHPGKPLLNVKFRVRKHMGRTRQEYFLRYFPPSPPNKNSSVPGKNCWRRHCLRNCSRTGLVFAEIRTLVLTDFRRFTFILSRNPTFCKPCFGAESETCGRNNNREVTRETKIEKRRTGKTGHRDLGGVRARERIWQKNDKRRKRRATFKNYGKRRLWQ